MSRGRQRTGELTPRARNALLALLLVASCGPAEPPSRLASPPVTDAPGSGASASALPTASATRAPAAADPALNALLIEAAAAGDAEQVRSLLGRGADVAARDDGGATALVRAAYRDHLEVARLLVSAGADVNTQDATRQSAYLIATSEGYLDLLELTLAAGADVHAKDSYNGTGLIRAADRGHVEIVRRLLQTPIEIDHVNRLGWTALLEAILLGDGGARHTETVRLLVNGGVDLNLADGNGVRPLAHARRRGFAGIAAILERAGARP